MLTVNALYCAVLLVCLNPELLQAAPRLALLLEPQSQEERSSCVMYDLSEASLSLCPSDITSLLFLCMFVYQSECIS